MARQPIFRIRIRIYGQVFRADFQARLRIPARSIALSQGQIVRDPEQPTANIVARSAAIQVLEQRQKDLLENFLAVWDTKPETGQIAKQRASELIEKGGDILRQPLPVAGGIGRRAGLQNR